MPLYREQTNPGETGPSEIRMMAQATYQRSNLTANNARYYIDTTVSDFYPSTVVRRPTTADAVLSDLVNVFSEQERPVLRIPAVCQAYH